MEEYIKEILSARVYDVAIKIDGVRARGGCSISPSEPNWARVVRLCWRLRWMSASFALSFLRDPAQDSPQVGEFLRLTTYPFQEETGNIAYQTFLAP
jgi:hypothetical protein